MGRTNRAIRDRVRERTDASGALQAARSAGVFRTPADIRTGNPRGLFPRERKAYLAFSSSGKLVRYKVCSISTSGFYRPLTKLA